ncbi:AI-2E family transporter [Lentilactobacillus sp. Marseille-Q4993]|uniref:AI-2E family transporter n=1 Tax=Lentilactobacillus sp. Marseille-Q4993 TaxID=3039492 RepID=UPI0024BCD118|nr:AI-2E family transporter [Lentilactobacillus sp. Marseille-Q4993]
MLNRLKNSSLFFWSIEILIVMTIIWVCTKVSFIFSPIAIFISTIFVPILLAGILFYMLNPIVSLLGKVKLGKYRISRGWGVAIVFVLLIAVIVLVLTVFVPQLTSQLVTLGNKLPSVMNDARDLFDKVFQDASSQKLLSKIDFSQLVDKVSKNVNQYVSSIVSGITSGLGSIISAAANIVIVAITVPVVLFYMLKDGEKLAPSIEKMLPEKHRGQIMDLLSEMSHTISKYIGGQMIECLFVGTFTAIGYALIHLPYALLLGFIAGLCNIIPYIGPYIGIAPALAVSLSTGNWWNVILNILIVLVVQQVDGNLVYPNVIGKALQIHPLTIIIILLAAGNIAGLMGMILAIPFYAVVKVVVTHLYNIFKLNQVE